MRLRIACPRKAPKNLRLFVLRNADAMVADREERLMLLIIDTDGHFDGSALWTILDGIAYEVAEHLFHAPGGGMDHEMRERCHER